MLSTLRDQNRQKQVCATLVTGSSEGNLERCSLCAQRTPENTSVSTWWLLPGPPPQAAPAWPSPRPLFRSAGSLLPPPRTLISETIAKYKDVSLIKEKAEKELQQVLVEVEKVSSEKVPVTKVITQASEPLLLEKKNDLNTEPTVNENKEVETSEKVKDAPVKKSTKRRASTRTKKVKETES